MEFWGVEVKAGQPLKVNPEEGTLLHLSQASLGESKKGNETVVLNLKVENQKFVIGTLSHDKIPQLAFDLVFEKEVELSHNWKNGSVYFIGYKSALGEEDDMSDDFDSDEDEPALVPAGVENGKPERKGEQAKAAKPEPVAKKDADDEDEDSDEDDESEDSEDDLDSDEDMEDGESDDSDEDEEDEKTPVKIETGKKRTVESATKTPASKKAKANTPDKKDGKKGGHVDTPHPAKQAGKTPGNKGTPKSAGQFACTPCKRSFASEGALDSHNKAKHSGK